MVSHPCTSIILELVLTASRGKPIWSFYLKVVCFFSSTLSASLTEWDRLAHLVALAGFTSQTDVGSFCPLTSFISNGQASCFPPFFPFIRWILAPVRSLVGYSAWGAKSQTWLSNFQFTSQFHTFQISHPGRQQLSILPVGFWYLSPVST